MAKKTMFEKIWDNHVIHQEEGKPSIIYIDLASWCMKLHPHKLLKACVYPAVKYVVQILLLQRWIITFLRKIALTLQDPISKQQIDTLIAKLRRFWCYTCLILNSCDQGVVHVMGPELGLTHPGKTIVCGDSHTSTHGAFGALAFGIGTSEVEHVMATQCLQQSKAKTMEVRINGKLKPGVTAKDLILGVIAQYGTDFRNRLCN